MIDSKGIVIGIDTGGTYTDGVAVDMATDTLIAKAKVKTTHQDLSIGIEKCIESLDIMPLADSVFTVCLSTTLATNYVVEGKTARTGLITMDGYRMAEFPKVYRNVDVCGSVDYAGNVLADIEEEQIRTTLKEMQGEIDALVISGYLCVRNPKLELKIKKLAMEYLDVPIICAHELSMSLGFMERTATAVLNAQLLPVIKDLISKTRKALKRNGIEAQLMIIKGDGTMMEEEEALQRPVETILSGPAASINGGAFLSGENDALFVDMGGTTTDIAYMKEGNVEITDDGAMINGWRTKVKAADVHTFGLGGDSRLNLFSDELEFGPLKAMPICYAAHVYGAYRYELYHDWKKDIFISGFHPAEGLILNTGELEQSKQDLLAWKVISLLQDGPHTIAYIASHLDYKERILGIGALLKKGVVRVISLTPTDLMHITGDFQEWDTEAAELFLSILATEKGIRQKDLLDELIENFLDQLAMAIIKSSVEFEGMYHKEIEHDWVKRLFSHKRDGSRFCFVLNKNIIALGAPAKCWITRLEKRLNTKVIVPNEYEVANAVGVAKGEIKVKCQMLIRHDASGDGYKIYMPWGMESKNTFEEAQSFTIDVLDLYKNRIEKEKNNYNFISEIRQEQKFLNPLNKKSRIYESEITLFMTASPVHFRK